MELLYLGDFLAEYSFVRKVGLKAIQQRLPATSSTCRSILKVAVSSEQGQVIG